MPGSGCEQQCLEQDQQDRAGQLTGTREGKPVQTVHLLLTSLHITSEPLLQLVRHWRRIEGWHWIHDTLPHEDVHRYRGQWCRHDGKAANCSAQTAEAGGCFVDPSRFAGGG